MKSNDNIKYIKGIGEARAKLFNRLGIYTAGDLLYHLPRGYEDRSEIRNISELMDGDTVCVRGCLAQGVKSYRARNRVTVTQTAVSDGTGIMRVTWFNSPYISATLKQGAEFTFYGKAVYKGRHFEMVNPVTEADSGSHKTGKIVPVYPSTSGLRQQNIRNAMEAALDAVADEITEVLPESVRLEYSLMPIGEALRKVHFPGTLEEFEDARRRLAFEELFVLQTGIALLRDERYRYRSTPIKNVKCIAEFAAELPFELTGAQKRVINEICADLKRDVPMNRLVQGDVGSGKTMVAAAAMYAVVMSGYQAVLMAPTEILAAQHYKNLSALFGRFGIKTAFLCGGMSAADKRESLDGISDGTARVIVGTHALITGSVRYKNPALVITDEQHRFGVRQRAALTGKGMNTHTLVMTATPIPRTLSLILYGDLDISVIDELPPGRKPIETFSVGERMRKRVNDFIIKNINEGRQAYIVCPLVEESETLTAKSVVEYAEKLKNGVFSGFSVEVMHGRLKPREKEEIMSRFASGETDILVSTTVIEVGVDVSNATVMVIENAERFGLSQLHQLRGRIGRGQNQSYCILLCGKGDIAAERMKVMCETNDGFKISEKDLELRGPGEFFGTRQHGLPELKAANLATDMEMLKTARDAAQKLIGSDPELSSVPDDIPLRERVRAHFAVAGESGILN